MSETTTEHHDDLTLGTEQHQVQLGKLGPLAFGVGLIFLVISAAVALKPESREIMAGSWIFGWVFWFSITLGMFGLSVLHHTLRSKWTLPLLRIFESGGGWQSLLTMAGLFLPLVVAPAAVYEWANPKLVAEDHILQHKAPYLNVGFWTVRFAIFFGTWALLAYGLSKSSKKQDANGDLNLEIRRSSWGAAGLVWFFISATFAALDWVMSLEPHWYSTMYGVWLVVGSALGALSFSAAVLCVNAKRAPYNTVVSPSLTKDIGNMLFCITMLWAYTSISQYLIIWNGNIPETTQYFIKRSHMGWNAIGMVTIVGQFLVPWMTLLSPRVKRYPNLLRQIAGWIFMVHIVDVYILVVPALQGSTGKGRSPGENIWLDLVAFLAVGGIWLGVFASVIRKSPLLVKYDLRLQELLKNAH